jgi:hypothetical protein
VDDSLALKVAHGREGLPAGGPRGGLVCIMLEGEGMGGVHISIIHCGTGRCKWRDHQDALCRWDNRMRLDARRECQRRHNLFSRVYAHYPGPGAARMPGELTKQRKGDPARVFQSFFTDCSVFMAAIADRPGQRCVYPDKTA